MKDIFSVLTERRIQEAMARGDFDNLSGAGKPLKIEGLFFLPRKLRAAYIVLKNSGYLDQTNTNDFIPPSTTDDLCVHKSATITKNEFSEKVYNHQVMMDCRRMRNN